MPQRSNMIAKNTPDKSLSMSQRMVMREQNTPEKSFPMPQRLNTPDKNPMNQRIESDFAKTPEMPQLKSLTMSSSTSQNKSPIASRYRSRTINSRGF